MQNRTDYTNNCCDMLISHVAFPYDQDQMSADMRASIHQAMASFGRCDTNVFRNPNNIWKEYCEFILLTTMFDLLS